MWEIYGFERARNSGEVVNRRYIQATRFEVRRCSTLSEELNTKMIHLQIQRSALFSGREPFRLVRAFGVSVLNLPKRSCVERHCCAANKGRRL